MTHKRPHTHSIKSPKALGIGALTALAVAVGFAWQSGAADSPLPQRADVLTVETEPLSAQAGYESKSLYPGRVRALRRSQLGFERGGLLADVRVNEGDTLAKGDVLAQLDQRTLKAQEAAAQANVTAAQAAHADAAASNDLAQATTRRQKQLLDNGHISPQRFDDARFAAASAQARMNSAKAQILQAKAQLESARVALSLLELRAPFDGVVVQRMADEGSILAPGAPIFDFEESARYEFVTGIPAALVSSFKPGQTAKVMVSGRAYTGEIKQIVGALDGATRTAQLILDLPDKASVVSGQVGQLEITLRQRGEGFWVPMEALQEGERGLWSVFVVNPSAANTERDIGTLQRHPVELLYAEIERAYVRGSIGDGALLVTRGLNRLISGQRVRLDTPLKSR